MVTKRYDVIIIGAGASGLMGAATAGQRGRSVLLLDHAKTPGQKIRMGGGGRCNFTNLTLDSSHYLCQTPHFTKSALSRYTQWDFLDLVQRHQIPYHERDHGQLFCDRSSEDILQMLLTECREGKVDLRLEQKILAVSKKDRLFQVKSNRGTFDAQTLVIATGGLSIPKAGASSLGHRIAEQFGLPVQPPGPGLVPLTLQPNDKQRLAPLSGIAIPAQISTSDQSFTENLLFTHRGLSGPVVLQISNYWQPGTPLQINLLPEVDLVDLLITAPKEKTSRQLKTVLGEHLPKRLIAAFVDPQLAGSPLKSLNRKQMEQVAEALQGWQILPNGTEGYRTAEVTTGGVDCRTISSKTFEARDVPGLYFIGEVLDVTGWLGGYNFQWAWSSGWCAGQAV